MSSNSPNDNERGTSTVRSAVINGDTPEVTWPNDEAERRGAAPTTNEPDLSQSSTLSLAQRRRGPVIARAVS